MRVVVLTPQAQKDLGKIPSKDQKKIIRQIRGMEQGVIIGKKLFGEIASHLCIRAWPYRIIYVELEGKYFIVHIKHHQGAYK